MPIGAPGKPDLGQPGANAVLAGEERRAAGGARLLAVIVQELDALAADAVDVRRLVAHQAVGVGADVGNADIVAEDDEDVRTPTGGVQPEPASVAAPAPW